MNDPSWLEPIKRRIRELREKTKLIEEETERIKEQNKHLRELVFSKYDIRTQPFKTNALTIHQLKEILSVLPDTNEYGEDYEVWIGDGGSFSNVVKCVCALNKREDGCDIMLEI